MIIDFEFKKLLTADMPYPIPTGIFGAPRFLGVGGNNFW